ncbi:MAG: hypothetical protein ALECFALPRED_002343 [Alectoria fallacina]|uniref:Uncharacterized protein n=1 Tax=Alectoria fallacina TaxID=1903189 RepID=A0A8H3FC42_9LECA|nr:MAG: hypothetical protein ALECFALPRED_002343 [Alectoria fallacina]
MVPPLITATIQSTVLTFCSLLIAQYLTSSPPPNIPALLLYTLLSTPPNYLWQQYIEDQFPGYTLKKLDVDDGGKGVEVEKRLNVRNTLIKLGLDQTIAAAVNVAAYIGGSRALRGVPLEECLMAVREQMWPVMKAGYKLWPAVNLVQHLFIPVERKMVVGSLVGMGWGVYLALFAAQ